MAKEMRKGWIMVGLGLALLAGLAGWAWQDGGERTPAPMSAPAMLPKVSG